MWVKFFANLLGKERKSREVSDEVLKTKRSWQICEEKLKPENWAKAWDTDLKEPIKEEIIDILKKARKGKSVSGKTVPLGVRS